MAVRQYIGARYVPKFYEGSNGSEWDANVQYEPLTIVTYLNNTYTSKRFVPASVGSPMSSPDYWVATGMYNEQLNAVVERVNALELTVGDEESGLVKDVDDLQTTIGDETSGLVKDVDDLQTTIGDENSGIVKEINDINTELEGIVSKVGKRKFIFIGDSYAEGTYGATGWVDLVNSILGLTHGVDSFDARNASQMFGGSFSDGSFKTQLTQVYGILDKPNEITDIYVFAGQNEYTYTDIVCSNKITEFITYAKTNFTNATVHLGFIGRGSDPQYFEPLNAKCRCYIQGAMLNGADYVNNIEYVNRLYSDYNVDKIHPNSYTEMANYIALGIVNGSVDVQRRKTYNITPSSNASGGITIIITQSNELIIVDISAVLSSFTANIVSGGTLAGTKLAEVNFDIVEQNFEIPFVANVRNQQNQFSNEDLFLVKSGSDLKIKCNKLIATGWQDIPAPADVSTLNITKAAYSAMEM